MLHKVKPHTMNTEPQWLSRFKEPLRPVVLLAALLFAFIFCPTVQAEEFKIVVHPDNPAASLKLSELTKIYLGKKSFFDSGGRIVPLDLTKYKPSFYQEVLNKNIRMITQYWTKAIFSGRGTPPREFSTVEKLVSFLKNTPGGLAYLPVEANIKLLKELKINP